MYIEYFCASLMITMNDIDVILSIPVSPVYNNALVLFNGKSLPTFVNHTIEHFLSHDATAGSYTTPCNKIDTPLVVY